MKKSRIVVDITSLVSVTFISGIQRVVREVLTRMTSKRSDDYTQFCLIAYNMGRRAYTILPVQIFLDCYQDGTGKAARVSSGEIFSFDDLGPDDIFFDIDSVWNNRMRRSFLLPILKKQGVKIAVHIYDIIPILYPGYCDELTTLRFMDYLGAHMQYADLVIANTQSTIHDIAVLSEKLGTSPIRSTCVPLGVASLKPAIHEIAKSDAASEIRRIAKSRYLLMVGTIEPRKNHSAILDAYEKTLRQEGFSLVIAGRQGWNVDRLMLRIHSLEKEDEHFIYLNNADDDTINFLYEHAFFTVFPTQYEGFGLPIIESILHKTPVIASDIAVLREVGGDYCDYYSLNDDVNLLRILLYYKENPNVYEQRKNQLNSYVPVSWDQSELQMWTELQKCIRS